MLLHDLLKTNAEGVDIGARATARVDLDPRFYLHKASGEAKPQLITEFVSDTVADTEEISMGPGATLILTSGTKPKLHAVSPTMWIAANARITAALYDSDDLDHGAAKDYMAYPAKIGELASRYTWASVLAYDQEYRRRQISSQIPMGIGLTAPVHSAAEGEGGDTNGHQAAWRADRPPSWTRRQRGVHTIQVRVSTRVVVVVVVVRELFSLVTSAICVRIRGRGQRLRRLFTT